MVDQRIVIGSPQVSEGEARARDLRARAHSAAEEGAVRLGAGAPMSVGLRDDEAFLSAAVQHFRSSASEQALSHAAEWMLDNFHLAQSALRQIRQDMPPGFLRELPRLISGALAGYPRCYDIAQRLVAGAGARLDMEEVRQFVTLYQEVVPLTTGELWALPVMLRLSVLDTLSQAVSRITGLSYAPTRPVRPIPTELTEDEVVANCFTGLRTLANQDWRRFFERVSLVERILNQDPAGVYPRMEPETRDDYRKAVESIAYLARRSEQEVAQAAIDLTGSAVPLVADTSGNGFAPPDVWAGLNAPPAAHVGYYLVDGGRQELESRLGCRLPLTRRLLRSMTSHPTATYLAPIALLTLLAVALAMGMAGRTGASASQQVLVAALALVPAITAAVAIVDWFMTLVVPARTLPKLDFGAGEAAADIPASCRTLVVIPSLLGSQAEAKALLKQIELHYLRNPEPELYFGLLTDFPDAPQQHMPTDEEILAHVRSGIQALNARYARDGAGPFCLFHRERRWNGAEQSWMGWERKRGKLGELNRWLRGATDTSFASCDGPGDLLRGVVRYVITLDADTILGRDAARRLVGALAHPLNRPRVDPSTNRVVKGYGILQPRTEITPVSANRSLFSRIFAGDTGLDLYSRAVSNVYQDLFGHGIYVGKGIYDVDSFERSLASRAPENTLLSHDLFEGIFARAGLVTDIVLYEDYPPNYLVNIQRQVRWARGDWQLLPWIAAATGAARGAPLNVIDRWKLLDNLRRSLLSPALLLLLVMAWLVLPGTAWAWTLAALLAPAIPALIGSLTPLVRAGRGTAPLQNSLRSLREGLLRWLLAIAFLPFEALQMLAAIGVTLVRVGVTHRRLLQWTTAAESARNHQEENLRGQTWLRMRPALLFSALTLLAVAIVRPGNLPAALPLLALWVLGPEIAYRIGQPIRLTPEPLTSAQHTELRRLARQTWLFFERFVGPEDHWLPPDHFSEHPRGMASPYTSPTNIGLLLVSTLAAYDLGYIGSAGLITRLLATFESLRRLERYRGHFLNWYDTHTLEPLPPRYVSTVDSGNLAACLIVLRQACPDIRSVPLLRWERWEGLADTLLLLEYPLAGIADAELAESRTALTRLIGELRERLLQAQPSQAEWIHALEEVAGSGKAQLDQLLGQIIEQHGSAMGAEPLRRLRITTRALHDQIFALQRNGRLLLPWRFDSAARPRLFVGAGMPAAVGESYRLLMDFLESNPNLSEHRPGCKQAQTQLSALLAVLDAHVGNPDEVSAARTWCQELHTQLAAAAAFSRELVTGLAEIEQQAQEYLDATDFGFLLDPQRQIFHIGYNVAANRPDDNYYDLLASEARIASLVALAMHQVPRSHWLHLARPLTQVDGARALLSWSATMFEYLMPSLFIRRYEGSLLYESEASAVAHQISYATRRGVPWGMSEAGYYAFDANLNYQYRAFGVPGLGFKRNLAEDLVITPYASFLALSHRPHAVLDNVARLAGLGALGANGFYEAVDFTPARLPLGRGYALVREYMAHHQGMILVSIANHLSESPSRQGGLMPERFHSDPRIQAIELLLQERVPADVPLEYPQPDDVAPLERGEASTQLVPWTVPVEAPVPHVHYLSNGRYSVLTTGAGSGVSRWQDLDLTRWRADATLDDWGTWVYVQDQDSGELWSATFQPAAACPDSQSARYYAHAAEFQRSDGDISLTMEITVAPEDDVEIRRITLYNHGGETRRLALTSYAEVVMAPAAADQRHPAFNKLFIESEYLPEAGLLLFRRRPRSEHEAPVYLAHMVTDEARSSLAVHAYESDRMRFVGRGRTARAPLALSGGEGLSGTTGATLDPIMSLQTQVELPPGESVQLAFITLAADARPKLLDLAARYRAWSAVGQAFDQSRARAEAELRQLGVTTLEIERMQAILSALLYPNSALRADPAIMAANTKGQPGLWAYGISGDYPILLVRIDSVDDLELVHDLLQAHVYWRRRLLKVDLVILNLRAAGYSGELRDQIHRLLVQMQSDTWLNQRGGVYIVNASQMPEEDRILLETSAHAVLDADAGPLAAQLEVLRRPPVYLPAFAPGGAPEAQGGMQDRGVARPDDLLFDNGYGGFSPGPAGEYVIYLEPGQTTPAPWVNVVANPNFGFLVSETGSGFTWALNSGENRLTPWSNDPVSDPAGEALYLRDEENGEYWSPTPAPCPAPQPYLVRHGAGYTIFEHHSHGLEQHLRLFVPRQAPVKIVQLRLTNQTDRLRRITATFYTEWVLGVTREAAMPYTLLDFDAESQALLARNTYNPEFGGRVAFAVASRRLHGLTADRTEFLGRMGDRARPAALSRIGLATVVGAGLDPCAALQVHLDLLPGTSEEVWFVIGQGADRAEALNLATQYKDAGVVEEAWQGATVLWTSLLGSVQVRTPDPAMDLLLNRWLLYQALACRIWGRSAFYQSSGAFGFRDQLQDVMAVIHAAPHVAREQILRAARHQFEAGDVLHWWHPPSGRGVRTRCSDDLLWLPFVTAHYVSATGDDAILKEEIPFLRAAALEPGEEDRYGEYPATPEAYTLYEHCRRSLERGSTAGSHGLPLMGTGDWNDGMNQVGAEGRGESVWLGWFLHTTLVRFAELAVKQGDAEEAERYRGRAAALGRALEEHGWDGVWYIRAFYDDGSPLGSANNRECQIDSIAQSWAVLSGAADRQRAAQAMDAVQGRLIRPEDGLVLLFTPPFDKTGRNPGYIKGYLPGIRENGGQYTHAALWSVWAFAELGETDTAMELFRLINPIYHALTPTEAEHYKVEPYVVAADVYGVPPHNGRGGWTWYTGSAAWMYRLGLEGILGIQRAGENLRVTPRIPSSWPGFEVSYGYGQATYHLRVTRVSGAAGPIQMILDGQTLEGVEFRLEDDGSEHDVQVRLG